jgi:hypothetical protein
VTYRVRKQALTGKLVLQHETTALGTGGWCDVPELRPGEFEIVPADELAALRQRIARYERRAAGQRKSWEARKQKAAT